MKVLYLSNSIIPSRFANSIHVMKMCQAISKLHNKVTLVAPDFNSEYEKGVEDIFNYYGVDRCFEIKKLPRHKVKGGAILYALSANRYIKKIKPDLVYGRLLFGCYLTSLKSFPTVYESHAPAKYGGRINDFIFKCLLSTPGLKKVVVISEKLKQFYYRNYYIDDQKILTAHDAADTMPNNVNLAILKSNNENSNIGYVGQLYPGRGMELISKLVKECANVNFHVVGGMEEDINKWKRELQQFKNIHFYGFVPHSKINEYLKSFDILIAPYLRKVSGYGGHGNTVKWMSPLKIFEYMSAGKAIVSSDLDVLKEVLSNRKNAVLCNPDKSAEWVKAIKMLNDNHELRKKLGDNASKEFLKYHTWLGRAEKIFNAIV